MIRPKCVCCNYRQVQRHRRHHRRHHYHHQQQHLHKHQRFNRHHHLRHLRDHLRDHPRHHQLQRRQHRHFLPFLPHLHHPLHRRSHLTSLIHSMHQLRPHSFLFRPNESLVSVRPLSLPVSHRRTLSVLAPFLHHRLDPSLHCQVRCDCQLFRPVKVSIRRALLL